MAKYEPTIEPNDESANPMQTTEKIKADIFDLQSGAARNGKERSFLENALLDLTRSALGNSLDDFADELPPEKRKWMENVKKALNQEISRPDDNSNGPDVKLNLIRIEIAREAYRVDQANETEKAKPGQQTVQGSETIHAAKQKRNKKHTPYNLNQVLLRRTLI